MFKKRAEVGDCEFNLKEQWCQAVFRSSGQVFHLHDKQRKTDSLEHYLINLRTGHSHLIYSIFKADRIATPAMNGTNMFANALKRDCKNFSRMYERACVVNNVIEMMVIRSWDGFDL